MNDQDLIILDSDKAYAKQRIAELEAEIQSLGPEFYEVFNQSSETWHDNAPFEAVRDRQSLLNAEAHKLRHILRNSLPSVPKSNKKTINVGAIVTVSRISDNEASTYYIAGDWTYLAGQQFEETDAIIMSRQSPLAKNMHGLKTNDQFSFKGKTYLVISIEY